jgi:dTDP-4-amino-4,6-dideoxygalactose transaminase
MPAYPTSIDAIPELREQIGVGKFPIAESCAAELITLPTHRYVTEKDVSKLGELISRVIK